MTGSKDHKDKGFNLRQGQDGLLCLLLLIAILVSYWQVASHEFVYDDIEYITENSHVKAGLTPASIKWSLTTTYSGNWHPLTWLSHMLDIQLFGMNAGRHHFTSLMFHIANSLLLFLVLKRMTGAIWPSFFTAALFALHPLNVESVAWVSERKNVLSTLFWFLAMGGYTLYVERPSAIRYLVVFLLLFLGLTAKPMLVTLPFVLLLLDYWPFGRLKIEPSFLFIDKRQRSIVFHLLLEKIPFFVLIAASCILTIVAEQRAGSVTSLERFPFNARISNAIVSYVLYMEKMFWPEGLAVLYPYLGKLPLWQVAGACMVLLVISLSTIRVVVRHPYYLVGWFWYIGTLVPVIGLVQVGHQAMADRYAYVPLIGLFMMTAWAFYAIMKKWQRSRLALILTAITLGAVLMSKTAAQVRYWADSITLFKHAVENTENNYVMHCSLGLALADQGRITEAIRNYSESLQINPNYAKAHNNLGIALQEEGKIDEAILHYAEVLRLNPNNAKAQNNLGSALAQLGRIDEAIEHFSSALHINPGYAEAHNNLGVTLAKAGRAAEAIDHYTNALHSNPDYTEAHMNLGVELNNQGRIDEAIDHFQKALSLKPEFPEAMYHLAKLYIIRDEHEKALSLYQNVLSFLPNNPVVYYNIACIYARQNRSAESVAWLQKAVARGFDNWEHIKTDNDLNNIRGSLSYKEFVKDHAQ